MIEKDCLLQSITPLLKQKLFKKKGNTWTLNLPETIIVFNIQISQFDSSNYYINIGSILKIIEEPKSMTISSCHIWQRMNIEFDNAEQLVKMIDIWISWYGSNNAVYKNILSNHIPKTTQGIVYKYLSAFKG